MLKYLSVCLGIAWMVGVPNISSGQSDYKTDSTFKSLLRLKNDSNKIKKLRDFGYDIELMDSALSRKVYQICLQLSDQLKDDNQKARSLKSWAGWYTTQGNYDSAEAVIKRGIVLSQNPKLEHIRGGLLINYGGIFYQKGLFDSSLAKFIDGVRIMEKFKDHIRAAQGLGNIANLYYLMSNYPKAKSYIQQAIGHSKASGDQRGLGRNESTLGLILFELKEYDQSFELYKQSLMHLKKANDWQFIQIAYQNLAENYLRLKKPDPSGVYADSSLMISRKLNIPHGLINSLIVKGKICILKNELGEAEKYLNEAGQLALKDGNVSWIKKYYNNIYQLREKQGNYKEAFQYLNLYNYYEDSLSNLEQTEKITEIESKYQVEKKQSQITQLEKEKEIQSLTIQQQNTWLFASVAGLTLAVLLGFFVYRNSRQKQKIQRAEIENLRKEKQLDALSGIIKGEENERNRMAQDLHDGLGSLLSGVKLSLTSMKGGTFLSETQTQLFGHSLDQLDNAISEMRRVAHNLMPSVLAESGLIPALQQFTESLNESGSIQVHFEHFNFPDRMTKEKEIVAYRMIQEAVNNAIRHSGGSQIILQISRMDNQIHIEIEDNGKGFDPASVSSSKTGGLKNLQNRAQYLNGTISFQSSVRGTTVRISFPV
jgi:two-component system, NarL family, sensor kinase